MISSSPSPSPVAQLFVGHDLAANNHTKPIATMDQAEKVNLANQIADCDISSTDIETLCADPAFTSEFLNNAEVLPILLTAVLQRRDIGDAVVQAMKEPACISCIEPDVQASIMNYVSHWLSALQDQPEMTFAIKFFEDIVSKDAIMDAIGRLAIANACHAGVLDPAVYVPLLSDAKELFKAQYQSVHTELEDLNPELVLSRARLVTEKAKLLELEAENPNDPVVIELRRNFDEKVQIFNEKIDRVEQLKQLDQPKQLERLERIKQLEEKFAVLEKSINQLQGFVDLCTGEVDNVNPMFYMSERELAVQKALFMAQFGFNF